MAQPAQCLIHRDPREPRCKAGVAAKILQMRERADIGLLHHVLGFPVIAQDAAGEPVEFSIVRRDDGANRSLVAPKGAPDQFGVAACGGGDLGGLSLAHGGSLSL